MTKAINLRTNQAKADVPADLPGKFAQGQQMAEARNHPTDTHKQGQHHTTDDGVRTV